MKFHLTIISFFGTGESLTLSVGLEDTEVVSSDMTASIKTSEHQLPLL